MTYFDARLQKIEIQMKHEVIDILTFLVEMNDLDRDHAQTIFNMYEAASTVVQYKILETLRENKKHQEFAKEDLPEMSLP